MKCDKCLFCNSLNNLAWGLVDHPMISEFMHRAQAVIMELCDKTDEVPFYATHNYWEEKEEQAPD